MEKLEKLEKYVKVPDTQFYGVYFYDGIDRELHNETITEGEYTLTILDIVENGIFKKHKVLTDTKGLKEETFIEYPLKDNDMLVFIQNEGFTKTRSVLITIDEAIERLKLLDTKYMEVEDDIKRDEG